MAAGLCYYLPPAPYAGGWPLFFREYPRGILKKTGHESMRNMQGRGSEEKSNLPHVLDN